MSYELGKLSVREFADIEFYNIPRPKVFFLFFYNFWYVYHHEPG